MSEYCQLRAMVLPKHLDEFRRLVLGEAPGDRTQEDDGQDSSGGVEVTRDVVSWGGFREMVEAAEAGLVFHGSYGPLGSYGGYLFAAAGGTYFECPCDHDDQPVVVMRIKETENGAVTPFTNVDESITVVEWYACRREVLRQFTEAKETVTSC